jgi:hypothetical protein
MKQHRIVHFAIAALAVFVFASVAHADSISIALTQDSQTATAGSAITFNATLTNLSSTDTVYLNADSSTTSSLLLSVDDTPFLTNAPLSLDPGMVSGPFALFNVIIDPSTPSGIYDFNSFAILGGLDANASDTLGTANFSVTVGSTSPVPEPTSGTLGLIGFLAIFATLYLKKIQRFSGLKL